MAGPETVAAAGGAVERTVREAAVRGAAAREAATEAVTAAATVAAARAVARAVARAEVARAEDEVAAREAEGRAAALAVVTVAVAMVEEWVAVTVEVVAAKAAAVCECRRCASSVLQRETPGEREEELGTHAKAWLRWLQPTRGRGGGDARGLQVDHPPAAAVPAPRPPAGSRGQTTSCRGV